MEEGYATQWPKTKMINGQRTIYKKIHRKQKIILSFNKTMTIITLMNKNGQHRPQKKISRFRSEVWTKREISNHNNNV